MANLTPKDYFGNELYVEDSVVFSPTESTDLIEGIIERIENLKFEEDWHET